MKSIKKKKSGGGAKEFLVWHGEKIAVGILVIVALWFAMQGLGYHTVSWQPDTLERDASETDTAIRNSARDAEAEGIELFDHASFAQQIREPIPLAPYRNPASAVWNPETHPTQRTGAGSSSMSPGGF